VGLRRVFRLGGVVGIEREVDDELAFHFEMRTRQLMQAGLAPDAARAEAQRQFGDVGGVRQRCIATDRERERLTQRARLLDEWRLDLHLAIRLLRRSPLFALTVVLLLAVGIGASTAIFTLVDAILLRPLPVAHPEQLIVIGDPARTSSFSYDDAPFAGLTSYPLYTELRDGNDQVSGLLASGRTDRFEVLIDSGAVQPEHPQGRYVSGNYFAVLGLAPTVGRLFDGQADEVRGAASEVVISYAWWRQRFHGDPAVIGRVIRINGIPLTIIGVGPRGYTGEIVGTETQVWVPIAMYETLNPHNPVLDDRTAHWLQLIGRRKPGVTEAAARAGFTAEIHRLMEAHAPAGAALDRIRRLPIPVSSGMRGVSRVRHQYGAPLITLMIGVGLLLVICCANAANLLLARAVARHREITVRVAIGAKRFRLLRQLLAESLVLALPAAVGGLALAWYGSRLLLVLAGGGGAPIPVAVRLDWRVLTFTMLAAIVAVVLSGLAPSIKASRVDLASAMRTGTRAFAATVGARWWRPGSLLISGQVALSLVLLVGAGLLVRSLRQLETSDTGLDRDHLLVVEVDQSAVGFERTETDRLTRELSLAFGRLPGVAQVTYSENGLFSGTESTSSLQVPGFEATAREDSVAHYDRVGPGYARAIGARLLRGRDISTADAEGSAPVALVNEAFAHHFFGERDPVGEIVRLDTQSAVRVVGVIGDVQDHTLEAAPVPRFYLAFNQQVLGDPGSLRFELRTAGDPARLVTAVRSLVREVEPQITAPYVDPLSRLMRFSIRQERLLANLATGFGALALLLAAFGLYGVLAYAVSRRTGEIGLRVALGARRSAVVRLVLGDALRVVAVGLIVGLPLARGGATLLRGQLHGIGAGDSVSVIAALAALGIGALAAALLPAIRASRVDPLIALRAE
jgi:predicted permease